MHSCTLQLEKTPQTLSQKFKSFLLISPANPLRLRYFKSDLTVRKEQERHLRTNPYAIHPFSKFRGMYEVFLVWLYTSALFTKPMNAFVAPGHTIHIPLYIEYTIVVDFFCWLDIILTFFTGFVKGTPEKNVVELGFCNVARHYILSPYFVCDVLSSFPKGVFHYSSVARYTNQYHVVHILLDTFMALKFVRVVPLFSYIFQSAQYLQVKSKTAPFLTCTLLTAVIIFHWAACAQFGIPKLTSYIYVSQDRFAKSWIKKSKMFDKPIFKQYCHSFFKSSAYILGIRPILFGIELPEEYVVALLTYFIGKLLVAAIWLILAGAILNSRSIEIKFLELINQLDEYMTRRMLPMNLRQRISDYYNFLYQKKYFKEEVVISSLSGNVKKDMTLYISKNMIKNVTIFSDLSTDEISSIMGYLVPELYMPQDTIIQHGSYGDAMYFLATGTVAVYTHSGKEICHLQDGAYFGEIALLLPEEPRTASVIAIETSLVYRLKKRDFEKCVLSNKSFLNRIMRQAEDRLRMATATEKEYKKFLLEQSLKASRFSSNFRF